MTLLKFHWKNLEKMSQLVLIILVEITSSWLPFEVSQAIISIKISSMVTSLREKQPEEFVACLILRIFLSMLEKVFNGDKNETVTYIKQRLVDFKTFYYLLKMVLKSSDPKYPKMVRKIFKILHFGTLYIKGLHAVTNSFIYFFNYIHPLLEPCLH